MRRLAAMVLRWAADTLDPPRVTKLSAGRLPNGTVTIKSIRSDNL